MIRPIAVLLAGLLATVFIPPALADAPPAAESSDATDATDATYRDAKLADYLVGTWFIDKVEDGVQWSSEFTYGADRKFVGTITRVDLTQGMGPNTIHTMQLSGSWSVDGDVSTEITEKTSSPDYQVPHTERARTLVVDATHLIFIDLESGKRSVHERKPETTDEHVRRVRDAVPDPGSNAWVEVERGPAGISSYDKSTLDRRGDIVGAWIRVELSDATIDAMKKQSPGGSAGPGIKSMRTYTLTDCRLKLIRPRQLRFTLTNGQEMSMSFPTAEPGQWERLRGTAQPNSPQQAVCAVKP